MVFTEKDNEMIDEFYDAIDYQDNCIHDQLEQLGKRKAYIGYVASIKKLFDENEKLKFHIKNQEDKLKHISELLNFVILVDFTFLLSKVILNWV
jgi:ABC-type transport system involved in cytochrome c biogenesis ATPase subunit